MDTNCCIFTGRLTKNAEMKVLPNGNPITTFSLGFSEPRKSKTEPDRHEYYSNYINCVIFGNYGKVLFPALKKGQEITVTTRLHQNRWEKDGKKYSGYDFIVNNAILQRQPKKADGQAQEDPLRSSTNLNSDFEPEEIEDEQGMGY